MARVFCVLPPHDIAVLGLNYPPERTGIAPYTGALASALQREGYRVAVHVAHPHYPEWEVYEGFGQWTQSSSIDGVAVKRRLHYVPSAPRGLRRLVSELSFGVRLVFAKWNRPRVIIAVSPSLFSSALALLRLRFAPRRKRTPSIVWVQDIYTLGLTETGEGNGIVQRITQWVEARTLQSATRVVVIHQRFAEYVIDILGVDESKVSVVRNWVHLPHKEPVSAYEARLRLGWPADGILVVHAGNMGSKQGLENVVEAARLADVKTAPVHFILLGDGGERQMLEQRAKGISRLTFVDPLGNAEFFDALFAADILLVNEKPGVSAMAAPSKLTSYFHAARPVVAATDPDGITASEVRASTGGVIVPAGEPQSLLDAVLTLGASRETMAQYGINGRRYREKVLDEKSAIDLWVQLIDQVSKPHAGGV